MRADGPAALPRRMERSTKHTDIPETVREGPVPGIRMLEPEKD